MSLIEKKFNLSEHCYLVKGAQRGAIYNFKTKDVYSVNAITLFLLEQLEKGKTLNQSVKNIPGLNFKEMLTYLKNLEDLEIGKFISDNEIIKKTELKKPPETLSFIWLEITTSCNLRCIHCYASSGQSDTSQGIMTEKNWEKVMEESHALGCRRLQLIGGEPFCIGVNNLLNVVQIARNIGYEFIEVYTNCTMINSKVLKFFKENNVAIATSLYGSKAEIHDSITQQIGSFNQTVKIIKKIVKLNLPLRVGIIEMRQNTENIKETEKFLYKIGVQEIKIDIVRPSGRGCNEDLLNCSLIDKQNRKSPFFPKCSFSDFQKAHYGHNCFANKICITANGDILPCIMERNVVIGNILKDSLQEIMSSEGTKRIRNITKDEIEVCRDCEYRYCCFDCRVRAENFYSKPLDCLYNPYTGKWLEK